MSGYRCLFLIMTLVIFVMFAVNVLVFLEQFRTASCECGRKGRNPEEFSADNVVVQRHVNASNPRKHLADSQLILMQRLEPAQLHVVAPPGAEVFASEDGQSRILSRCKNILTAQGYRINHHTLTGSAIVHGDQRVVVEGDGSRLDRSSEALKTPYRPRDSNRLHPEKDNKPTLEHPLLMKTDDDRVQQSTPWGRIPDECFGKKYGDVSELFAVSVIICFHENEVVADVLHTVHSVVQRTPRPLLREILLIDDCSKKEEFQQILEQYVSAVFTNVNVRIIRNTKHMGLIQCRLHGARVAEGDTLFFMDSHMEVQPLWLEPLLWEIKENPQTLATSYLDWIKRDAHGNWSYVYGSSSWKTYFDWNFVFGFQITSQKAKSADLTSPIRSPVTVGGVFAISRRFFFQIGAFDEEMWGWGGENLDLSIRVWLFGGRVINVPCSHVGHTETSFGRSYRSSWQESTNINYKRVTEVWLGEYKKYIYYYNPSFKSVDAGNLTSRLEVRYQAPRSFGWILENVFPELGLYDKNTLAWGGLKNLHFNTCLWSMTPQTNPILSVCDKNDTTHQGFFLNDLGELRFPIHVFNVHGNLLQINEYIQYYDVGTASSWIHWPGGPMQLYSSNLCLDAKDKNTVTLMGCNQKKASQRWMFSSYSDKLYAILKNKPATQSTHYWYALYKKHLQAGGKVIMKYDDE